MKLVTPPQAYVPGQTERHAEGAFDGIRQSALPGMTVDELAQSAAFRHGLTWLDEGYFWEAHEVLEPVWMALPAGEARSFVQGLIQLANALLKEKMEKPKAALRLCTIVRELVPEGGDLVVGVDQGKVLADVKALEGRLHEQMKANSESGKL